MSTTTEKKDIINKAGVPMSGPYVESARRLLDGEYEGPVGGAEPDPNGEEGSGRVIAANGMITARVNKPKYCR